MSANNNDEVLTCEDHGAHVSHKSCDDPEVFHVPDARDAHTSKEPGFLMRVFVGCARVVFNAMYRLAKLQKPRQEVIFVSRKMNEPSYNFREVAREFQEAGYEVVFLTKYLSARSVFSYSAHIVREIWHLGRAAVCVLDRYDPVVSLIDFPSETLPVSETDVDASNSAAVDGVFDPAAGVSGATTAGAAVDTTSDVTAGVPVASLTASPADASRPLHREVPLRPVIIQLWHAFGAFKKFGYQSVGTIEGHSLATARLFGIHRNYSWMVCTGESSRVPFAEAFSYPVERVMACGLPEQAKLEHIAAEYASCSRGEYAVHTDCTAHVPSEHTRPTERLDGHAERGGRLGEHVNPSERWLSENADIEQRPLRVLFAPTLRKSSDSAHPFHELQDTFAQMNFDADKLEMRWQFHPIEQKGTAAQDVPEQLLWADVVVTDYSSIVYEAYLLGKIVLFYVPDIDEYRLSPGLNADPEKRCPEICFESAWRLVAYIESLSDELRCTHTSGDLASLGSQREISTRTSAAHASLRIFIGDVFDEPYRGVMGLLERLPMKLL